MRLSASTAITCVRGFFFSARQLLHRIYLELVGFPSEPGRWPLVTNEDALHSGLHAHRSRSPRLSLSGAVSEPISSNSRRQSPSLSFCQQIHSNTRALHCEAENTELMKQYLSGTVTIPQHCNYLLQFCEIHRTLEECIGRTENVPEDFRSLFSELKRSAAFESDLLYLLSQQSPTTSSGTTAGVLDACKLQVNEATRSFVAHLNSVAKSPFHLIAHAYVQYRALLNGGYVLRKRVEKLMSQVALSNQAPTSKEASLTIAPDTSNGTQAFVFPRSLYDMDSAFVLTLNRAAATDQFIGVAAFIEEVSVSYQLSIRLLNSTQGLHLDPMPKRGPMV